MALGWMAGPGAAPAGGLAAGAAFCCAHAGGADAETEHKRIVKAAVLNTPIPMLHISNADAQLNS